MLHPLNMQITAFPLQISNKTEKSVSFSIAFKKPVRFTKIDEDSYWFHFAHRNVMINIHRDKASCWEAKLSSILVRGARENPVSTAGMERL